jgi:hypothetical protein
VPFYAGGVAGDLGELVEGFESLHGGIVMD